MPWRDYGGEVVALDMATASYYTTNAAGRELWTLLARGATRSELVGRLVEEFGIDVEQAEADVDAFLGELADQKLLESRSAPGAP